MGKGGDDAELHHRRGANGGAAAAAIALKHDAAENVLAKLDTQHICIDGIVYELGSFPTEHPGGESIAMFGGSDCTVHYRMIHPTHKNDGSALRRRMAVVGPLEGWQARYTWGSAFEKEVKDKVAAAIPLANSFGSFSNGFFLRAGLLLSALFVLEWQWAVYGSSVLLAVMLGMVQAMIGLAVQHDANHGAACRNHRVNALLGFGADLIGGSKYLWMEQHWTHHAYTNDHHLDPDASSADPVVLFHDHDPKSQGGNPRRWWSPFQHLLLLPVLSFYWITSVLNPQILTLSHASSATKRALAMHNEYFVSCRPIACAIRASYILVVILAPFCHAPPLMAAGHVLLMGAVESLHLASLFALSHNFEGAERHPQANGTPDWFTSQVETSCTYGGAIAGWLTGGLNYQIEHHLFPRMCSVHYPTVQPIVEAAAKKHGVRYTSYPYLWNNARSTARYLAQAGDGRHWLKFAQPLSGKM